MKRIHLLLAALATLSITSCTKELSLEQQETPPPPVVDTIKPPIEDTVTYTIKGNYQLKNFYSDLPIDYIETDTVVKSETALWGYVSGYLKDDVNDFVENSNEVIIEQRVLKMEGLNDAILHKVYSVGTDDKGPYLKFLDNEYKPLKYRVFEIGKDYFILAFPWKNGATLFSRFERV